jgi:hypothetical protein
MMAARFSADSHTYSRSVSLGAQAAFSWSCWLQLAADRNTYSCVLSVDSGTASDAYVLMTGSDGTTLGVWDESAQRASRALTVGVWYWVGVAINGANGLMVSRAPTDATPTASTWSTGSASTNQATFRIGRSPNSNEFLNGRVCAVKWWGTNLTQAELENEALTYLPQRTANLRAWYPLLAPDTADYSGNSTTLSGGTGATVEDGPPLSWGRRGRRRAVPGPPDGWGAVA